MWRDQEHDLRYGVSLRNGVSLPGERKADLLPTSTQHKPFIKFETTIDLRGKAKQRGETNCKEKIVYVLVKLYINRAFGKKYFGLC